MQKNKDLYYPSEEFKKSAWMNNEKIYKTATKDPVKFWEKFAGELLWKKKWEKGFLHNPPYFQWFSGGKMNVTENIFERNLEKRGDKTALIWQPEPTTEQPKKLTYRQLYEEVNKFSNALLKMGIKKGDRVGIYLPMIPEVIISMLACARIGAVHAVVFSAFSPTALQTRLTDSGAKILITSDGYYRNGGLINLKNNADEGVKNTSVGKMIVVKRAANEVSWVEGRDVWWHELVEGESTECPAETMDSEDPLFILYTSGCCHKDTLVQLDTGEIKKISELVEMGGSNLINTDIKTLEQKTDPIIDRHRYHEFTPLLNIKTPLSNIKVTPNHHLFILNKDGGLMEKEAAALKEGDHILQSTKINIEGSKQKLPSSQGIEYYSEKCNHQKLPNKPNIPSFLTPALSQVFGYLVGDGGLSKRRIEATDKDRNNLLFYKNLIKKELKLRCFIKNYDRQRLVINSTFLSRYFNKFFPELFTNSYQRKIPKIIQKSKQECIGGFIRGLFDAEGCVNAEGVKITSQSKELIQVLQMLFLRFGIVTNYFEEKRTTHFGKNYYKILVHGLKITDRESLKVFKSKVNFSSQAKSKNLSLLFKKLNDKKIASMIRQFPINHLMRLFRKTITLPKKECRRIHLDSYIYTNRRIKANRISKISGYIQEKINLIENLDLSKKKGVKTAISLFKVSQKDLAKLSGKSVHTVHQYHHRRIPLVSQNSLDKFYTNIVPYLAKLKEEKLKILREVSEKIKKLEKTGNYGFFEIKKITRENNDSSFVYDITASQYPNYIANSFIVHNSTGRPKGCLHTTAGYAVQAYATSKWIFDLKDEDVFWSTADIGWITGHTYSCYGPLLCGATFMIFEGLVFWPEPDRWAQIIEKHKVSVFYTAPTAIRMFEKYGAEILKKYEFKTLRLLGSVGEPIDESAWLWYFNEVGKGKCPLVDTWWQTETGGILITSLPGIGPFKPAFTGLPFPGTKFDIKDGNLVMLPPFAPGMLRGLYKNPDKYLETYWSQYDKETYFTSDGALKDEQGLIRIIGRVDDVIKVAGHRVSTGELEAAINGHSTIIECAVVGVPDEIKGEVPMAFVVYHGEEGQEEIKKEVIGEIMKEIGPIALPKAVFLVEDLPKTRSGKIMRRILRKLWLGEELGDLSTLSNPESVEKIKQAIKQ